MLGLRTTAGVDLDDFAARYGLDLLAANDALVASLVAEGRLVVRNGPEGRRLLPTRARARRRGRPGRRLRPPASDLTWQGLACAMALTGSGSARGTPAECACHSGE